MPLPCLILRRAKARGFAQLLILSIALCATKSWAQAPVLLVLGDSISAGYGMTLKDGWVQLLAERLQTSHPEWSVVNASISGETTAGGLRRLPALITSYQPQTVIIELGGNDGLRGYPISQLRSNLAQLIQLSTAADAEVLVTGMEIPPNFGSRYTALFRRVLRPQPKVPPPPSYRLSLQGWQQRQRSCKLTVFTQPRRHNP